MAFEVKRASAGLSGATIGMWRFAFGLGGVAVAALAGVVRLRFREYRLLALRGLCGGLAVLCFFTTIQHLDVSIATLLNFTSPVFAAFLASLFLRERVGGRLAAAMLLTLGGVALITRAHAPPGSWGFGGWTLLGLTGAALSGAANAAIRALRLSDVGSWEIFAAFCLFGLAATAPVALAHPQWPGRADWIPLTAVAAFSLFAQIASIHAYRAVAVAPAGTIAQLTPVTTLVLGALLLGEPVTAPAIAGAALTLAGVIWATLLPVTSPHPSAPVTT
jgi:drug/metabolite transporter (DMT)-like permease